MNFTTKEYDIFPTTDINCKNITPLHFTALVRVFKRYSEEIKVMNSKEKYLGKFLEIKFYQEKIIKIDLKVLKLAQLFMLNKYKMYMQFLCG